MFDETSFAKDSFDERSWFFGVVEAVAAWLSRGKAVLLEYKYLHIIQERLDAAVHWRHKP